MSLFSRPNERLCGCWFPVSTHNYFVERRYLPQVELSSSTNILATTSRTTLKQTFVNIEDKKLEEVQYTFPLYDGVSVVGFTCTVGSKTIVGIVKEKQQARVEYQEAVARGETAGLLEQLPEASDVFTTSIGNVPPKEKVHVEIVYLGELKHDAETDGSRFTLPTIIAPRYGSVSSDSANVLSSNASNKGGISISIDVTLEEGTIVRGLQSPSHPLAVTMGRTSIMDEDAFNNNHASATLTLGTTELDKDFIVIVLAKGTDTPRALLETHPTIPNQRAIMTTLVPKFNIPSISPEVVFIVDRSGSMEGKIELVVAAMKIFLKSLPVGIKFNICSFGSRHSFLFKKSKTYDQSSLKEALKHLDSFSANYGGTEMLQPVKETVKNRYKDLPLEVMILTDGEIWNQQELFDFVNETENARFFTLGIGYGASSALVEGIAHAGNGFAQFVGDNEKMDKRVVRMLKGALTPHISDYTLEVNYGEDGPSVGDDDFEMVDAVKETTKAVVSDSKKLEPKKPISLFDTNATEEPTNLPTGRYDNLPTTPTPNILQAPYKIPALFPFNRTTVYLLLDADAPRKTPKSISLRGTSDHGPLELSIPVQNIGTGETIHQLAAKKAVSELEQGRGWITEAQTSDKKLLKTSHESKWDLIVEREAVRLGVLFQVGGKWCSFVAVEKNTHKDDASTTPPAYSEKESLEGGSSLQRRKSKSKNPFDSANSRSSVLFGGRSHSLSRPPQTSGQFSSATTFGSTHTAAESQYGAVSTLPATRNFGSACFGSGSSGFGATGKPSSGNRLFEGGGSLFGSSYAPASKAPEPAGGLFGNMASATSGSSPGGRAFGNDFSTTSATSNDTGLFGKPTPKSQAAGAMMEAASLSFPDEDSLSPSPSPPFHSPSSVALTDSSQGGNVVLKHSVGDSRASMSPTDGASRAGGAWFGSARAQAAPSFSPPGGAEARSLAQYQSGLMRLHQDNKARKMMAPSSASAYGRAAQPPPPPAAGGVAPPAMLASAPAPAPARSKAKSASFLFGFSSATRHRRLAPQSDAGADSDDDAALDEEEAKSKMEIDHASRPTTDAEKMHQLIDLQEFDGGWALSKKLLELLGLSKDQVKVLNGSRNGDETVSATAAAIAWLKIKVATEEDVWEMVVEKAMRWLASKVGGEERASKFVDEARKLH